MRREAVIGVALASVAAVGAIVLGVIRGLPALETFWRAALSAVVGFAAGWLFFGALGTSVVREAAGEEAESRRAGKTAGPRPPAGT